MTCFEARHENVIGGERWFAIFDSPETKCISRIWSPNGMLLLTSNRLNNYAHG